MFLLSKLKIYALAGVAILGAFIAVYFQGMSKGVQKVKLKSQEKRIEDLLNAKEVSDEINELDNDELYDRANYWLRQHDDNQ
jgi:hypothetical protein